MKKSFFCLTFLPYDCLLKISLVMGILILPPVLHIEMGLFDKYNQIFQADETRAAESD
jgi:hypothetical protein